jgi:hypothetical protein
VGASRRSSTDHAPLARLRKGDVPDLREWVREQGRRLPNDTKHAELLYLLQTYADSSRPWSCYPATKTLAAYLGVGDRYVRKLLRELGDEGHPTGTVPKPEEAQWGKYGVLSREANIVWGGRSRHNVFFLKLDYTLDAALQRPSERLLNGHPRSGSAVEVRNSNQQPALQRAARKPARRKRPGGPVPSSENVSHK